MGDLPSKELICEGELIDPVTNTPIKVITPKAEEIQETNSPSRSVNDPLLHLACSTEVIDPASIPDEMLQPEGSDEPSEYSDFNELDNRSSETEVADETFETAESQHTRSNSQSVSSSLAEKSSTNSRNHSPTESPETSTEKESVSLDNEPSGEVPQEEEISQQSQEVSKEEQEIPESKETEESAELREPNVEAESEEPKAEMEAERSDQTENKEFEYKQPQSPTANISAPKQQGSSSSGVDRSAEESSEEGNIREIPIHSAEDTDMISYIRLLDIVEGDFSGSESELSNYVVEEYEEIRIREKPRRVAEELSSTSPVPNVKTYYRVTVQEFDSEELMAQRCPNFEDTVSDLWIPQGCYADDPVFKKLEEELCRLARESTSVAEEPVSKVMLVLPPEFRLKVLEKFLTLPVIHGVVDVTELVYTEAKKWSPTPIRICWNLSEKAVLAAMDSLAWLSRPLHKPIHHLDDLVCKLMNTVANRNFEL